MRATLILALGLMLTAPAAAATITCQSPGGLLTLGRVDEGAPREILPMLPSGNIARLVSEGQGSNTWYRFAAEWPDSGVLWPKGQTIVVVTRGGKEIQASDIYVATPGLFGRAIRLGKVAQRVIPSDVECPPWKGDRAVALWVSFPGALMRGDIAGVQVRMVNPGTAAPGPGVEGPR